MSHGTAYDAMVGREMHANNFIHKFGALGSFLNGKNKPAPEANKTQERAKLPPKNQLGDMIRCHSKQERGDGGAITIMKQKQHLLGMFL